MKHLDRLSKGPSRRPVLVTALAAGVTAAIAFAACRSSDGSAGTPAGTSALVWAPGSAEAANGTLPTVTAAGACGSDKTTFLVELLTSSPLAAKVNAEWGDCVPGGKDVLIAGTVAATHLGPTDLPTSHPYGDDLSMDIALDPAFRPLALKLGSTPDDMPPGEMHVEISAGFIPHLPRPTPPAAGQTWRAAADANLARAGFQPDFDVPAVGDRIAIMGRWIIDCGHDNFTSEVHAMSFLAWAHVDGRTTTLRTYFNPYRDAQLFDTDLSVLGKVGDTARLNTARPFPSFLVQQILAINAGSVDRLRAPELIDATHDSPAPFVVCPPAGTSGASLALSYDVVRRTGVSFALAPDATSGCVTVTAALGGDYHPLDAKVHECLLPWPYLDAIAGARVGNPKLDLRGYLAPYVTSAQGKVALMRDPETSCADALAGPPVTATPSGQSLRTDDTQPFPFYGVVSVAWAPSGG